MKRNMITDELIEFKPKYPQAVWGVRNGSYRAYVYDIGHEPESWEGRRFKIALQQGGEVLSSSESADTLEEAKKKARLTISGRAFRSFLNRMMRGSKE